MTGSLSPGRISSFSRRIIRGETGRWFVHVSGTPVSAMCSGPLKTTSPVSLIKTIKIAEIRDVSLYSPRIHANFANGRVELLRFSVPRTGSSEAAAVLMAIYAAGRDLPPVATPRSALEFHQLHEEMEKVFGPPNERLAAELETFVELDELGGVPVLRLFPHGCEPRGQTLVYLHGGSHAFLSAASTVGTPALVARATGHQVFSIDFSRAPAARWRTITNEVLAVWQSLLAGGV